MPNLKTRMEAMAFPYATTNRNDFRPFELKAKVVTSFTPRPKKPRAKYQPVKDVHTMTPWQFEVPFYLVHKKKDVVQTNPHDVQPRFEKPTDLGREESQRTRPRLAMTPSVKMDDIADPVARKILCEDIYTTDAMAGMREAVKPYFRVEAPFPGRPAPSYPVKLPKYQPPVVPPEWRKDSISWDSRQRRSYSDTTRDFWLMYPPIKCRACDESLAVQKHRIAKYLAKHQN